MLLGELLGAAPGPERWGWFGAIALVVAVRWYSGRGKESSSSPYPGARLRWALALACAGGAFLLGVRQGAGLRAPVCPDRSAGVGTLCSLDLPARLTLEGWLTSEPTRRGRPRFDMEIAAVLEDGSWKSWHGPGRRVRVWARELADGWHEGDCIRAQVWVRWPRSFRNPGAFDYVRHLRTEGIAITASLWRRHDAEGCARAPSALTAAVTRARRRVAHVIDTAVPADSATMLRALVIGDRSGIDGDRRDPFVRAGTAHLLAISGLHLAVVAGASFAAIATVARTSRAAHTRGLAPRVAALGTLPVTLAYALLAGARVPTVRAAIMISLYLLAIALNRRRDLLRSLAIAAVVVGLWRPGAVFDPSFGLSFVAVLSIAIGLARAPWAHGPRWREDVAPPEDSVPGGPSGWRLWAMSCGRKLLVSIGVWIATSAIVAIAAAVGTAPLTARYFNLVSIVGPLANLVAVPLFSAAVVAALLGTAATAAVPGLGSAAALPLDLAAALVSAGERLIAVAAAAQWAALRVATPSPLEVALCYALMACVLGWHHRLGRVGLVVTLLVIGGDAAYWVRERLARPDLRVTFLDVGQGDAAVVEFPGHRVLVVDGGGFPGGALDPGEAAVARYLWSRKILRIDYLAMSHADVDHAGGLGFIAEEFRPRQLWWTGRDAGDPGVERVRTALRAGEGTEIALTAAIPTWTVGRVAVEVLHPDASAVRVARRNDASLVFRLRWGESAVLFTGDIERLGEAHLLRRHPGTLASTVLKVPHHGSRTSSGDAFVDAVGAKVAVVSVGGGNRYRFPHPEVERRYERGGVCLRRTDRDGAVTVRIDGAGYAVDPPCSPTPSRSLAGVGR